MRKLISCIMVFVITFTLCSCSKDIGSIGGGNNETTKVFVSISNKDTFISTIIDGMESYAGSNNIEIDVEDAEKNVEKQVEHIKAAAGMGYDVIVCILVDPDTATQIKSAAGDLPIVFINVKPDDSKLEEDKYIYIASNEHELVDSTTKYLLDKFKDKKSIDAVLFEGARDNVSTSQRSDDLKLNIQKSGLNVNYVFQDEADWSKDIAKEKFKVFLKMNRNFDVVLCNNDDMAMGVIEAMEENGLDPSSIVITGADGTNEAFEAIKNGKMSFTLKQSGIGQGESAMKAAQVLKSGGKIKELDYADESGKYIWYPYSLVDKSNVADYS